VEQFVGHERDHRHAQSRIRDQEARPWWKVQSLAIVLTIIMSVFVLVAFTLVVVGPEIAESIAAHYGLGAAFAWAWTIVQWPIVFLLISQGFART
jgi:membrane protein